MARMGSKLRPEVVALGARRRKPSRCPDFGVEHEPCPQSAPQTQRPRRHPQAEHVSPELTRVTRGSPSQTWGWGRARRVEAPTSKQHRGRAHGHRAARLSGGRGTPTPRPWCSH